MAAGTVTPSLFDQHDLAEVTSEDFPGERLIVCRNRCSPPSGSAKRHELLAATEKELEPIVAATRRRNDPLRGAADIGLRVGKVITRYKVAKHFVTTITDESFTSRRDDDKIADEEQLDGLYIVRSNVETEQFDAAETVRAYKDLSKVERAFRSLKTVDMKVRPIHHRRADRVRAHVFLRKPFDAQTHAPRSVPTVQCVGTAVSVWGPRTVPGRAQYACYPFARAGPGRAPTVPWLMQ